MGSSYIEGNTTTHAFSWTAAGGMSDLCGVGFTNSALAVNNGGLVVGNISASEGIHAALFHRLPADFTGDGTPELVWQNDITRQVTVWYMGGPLGNEFLGANWLSSSAVPGWRVVAVVDFNADGHPDLIWQNDTTRQVTVWYMGGEQGEIYLGADWLSTATIPDWRMVAATDFNDDGFIDLVWQHDTTRQVIVWYLGGVQGTLPVDASWLSFATIPDWSVVTASDFNADGHPDLVWRHDTTGQVTVWYMGGPHSNVYAASNWLNSATLPGWSVVTVADFNTDGHPDLVWQNDTTRQVTVWYMGWADGSIYLGSNWLNSEAIPEWSVVGR